MQYGVGPASRRDDSTRERKGEKAEAVIVYTVVDDALSPDFALGDSLEAYVRREVALLVRFLKDHAEA